MVNKIKIYSILCVFLITLFSVYSFKIKSTKIISKAEYTCPVCHGTGVCAICAGEGKITCVFCDGKGVITNQYNGEVRTCPACKGVGYDICKSCGGNGMCKYCNGTGDRNPNH